MKIKEFFIFSDESGKWNSGDEYYIRAWIRIGRNEYEELRKVGEKLKERLKIKELKWKNFKKNFADLDELFKIDFDVFITISNPKHFSKNRYSYNAIRKIEKIDIEDFGWNEEIAEKIYLKIVNAAENILFFNIYEKWHIINFKNALLNGIGEGFFALFVDSPQHLKKEWIKIAEEIGINKRNIKIVEHSENEIGIEIADIIAGCIQNMIKRDKKAKEIYHFHIKEKMLDMYSTEYPNPNLIFYKNFGEEERNNLNIFR